MERVHASGLTWEPLIEPHGPYRACGCRESLATPLPVDQLVCLKLACLDWHRQLPCIDIAAEEIQPA